MTRHIKPVKYLFIFLKPFIGESPLAPVFCSLMIVQTAPRNVKEIFIIMAKSENNTNKLLFKKTDIVIFLLLCVITLISFFVFSDPVKNSGEIIVYKDGNFFGKYSVDTDAVIKIGETNELTIKNSRVYMSGSCCDDHLCEKQNIETAGSIICLPNRVAVYFDSSGKSGGAVDAVAGD